LPIQAGALALHKQAGLQSSSSEIGYGKASAIAHKANDEDLSLKAAALASGYIDEKDFDRVVDPAKMV
jgi:fumarate hydratase class II